MAFGLPATHGISDIDLVYFDGDDLSQGAEASHAARIGALFADLGLWVDVKNEARVHLWYAEKFGNTLAPYVSTEDAITTFPTTATAVGVQPRANGLACLLALRPVGSAWPDRAAQQETDHPTDLRRQGGEVAGPLAGPSRGPWMRPDELTSR